MDIIRIDHLTKYYGKSRGITDLSLAVRKGEFFGFIGPNGAGKSTTIRILLGLIRATSGKASVFNMDVSFKNKKILENVGYIPSEAMFYHNTTVDEILRLSAGLRRKNCSEEARLLCDRLQLDARQKTDSLSLGSRKKVSIVCALQHNPDLCIFDEPTSGLDPLIQKEFFEILKERNKQGCTIFLSSHILSEVQKYCTRAAVIREGRLAACGDIAQLAGAKAKRITLAADDLAPICQFLTCLQRHPTDTIDSCIRDLQITNETVSFLFQGNIKSLVDRLSEVSYTDITIIEPELSEIFMHYYE